MLRLLYYLGIGLSRGNWGPFLNFVGCLMMIALVAGAISAIQVYGWVAVFAIIGLLVLVLYLPSVILTAVGMYGNRLASRNNQTTVQPPPTKQPPTVSAARQRALAYRRKYHT